jgi:hypothetical protein
MGEKPDDTVTPATWAPPQGTSALGVASVAVTPQVGGRPETSGLYAGGALHSLSPRLYGRVPTFPARLRLTDNGATRSEEGQLACHIVRSWRAPRHKCTMGEKPNDAVTPATWAPPQGTSALGVASVAVTSRAGGGRNRVGFRSHLSSTDGSPRCPALLPRLRRLLLLLLPFTVAAAAVVAAAAAIAAVAV